MKKIWVGTNWKMTKTIAEGSLYTKELIRISKEINSNIELFIIPSHTALVPIKKLTNNSSVHIGAQNMHWQESGPYTGEISPKMLKEIGIDIIELGHSERRQYFNETDSNVNKKTISALNFGLIPLICIGESLDEKNNNISKEILAAQLKISLKGITPAQSSKIMIAYEPIWAIGEAGLPADSEYINEIHTFIRTILIDIFGTNGIGIPILFGGSVNRDNFLEYIDIENVNGLFIGRAAWDIAEFEFILHELSTFSLNR